MEGTAGWRFLGIWNIARQNNALARSIWIELRNGRQKGLRIGVSRACIQALDIGHLDDLAKVHHRDPIAHMLDH
jgi:hypothetical protein